MFKLCYLPTGEIIDAYYKNNSVKDCFDTYDDANQAKIDRVVFHVHVGLFLNSIILPRGDMNNSLILNHLVEPIEVGDDDV